MTKCVVSDCEAAGTVSANHSTANWYCLTHGICGGCGESVEYFVHCEEMGIWICPCVASRRHEQIEVKRYEPIMSEPEEKKPIEFGQYVARKKKSRRIS